MTFSNDNSLYQIKRSCQESQINFKIMSEIPRSEQPEKFEKESEREKLTSLEKEGKWLFHGSAVKTDALEAKQPYNRDEKTGKMEKHGEPSIAASQFAEIAIFMAIVNPQNAGADCKSGVGINEEGKIEFLASRETLEAVKGKKGYVYVLSKSNFKPFSDMEWRADTEIKPEEVVEVAFEDLPQRIENLE